MAPNRLYLVFGSGLPDKLDPDSIYTPTPSAFNLTVEGNIGGVPATFPYVGSSGFPGLFQIVVMPGANTPSDCFNTFEIAFNGVPAASGTVPFSSSGGPCKNQLTGLTASQLKNPNLKFLTAGLLHNTLPDGTTSDSSGFFAEKSLFFERNLYGALHPNWGYGCRVDTDSAPGSNGGLFPGQVGISGGNANFPLPASPDTIGAFGVALPGGIFPPNAQSTFTWSGSEIPASSLPLTVPAWSFSPTVDLTTLKTSWTGAPAGSRLDISYSRTESRGPTVTCTVDGAIASFTPPNWVGNMFFGVPTTITVNNKTINLFPSFINDPDFYALAVAAQQSGFGK
jgi:hypothetical protein